MRGRSPRASLSSSRETRESLVKSIRRIAGVCALALVLLAVRTLAAAENDALEPEATALLNELADAAGPGAAIVVARDDHVLFRGARGLADVELGVALSPDDAFRIGSNTKQFTAATILTLAEQGRLATSDTISRFLPDYPDGEHITIDELLRHTSGIKDYTSIPGYFDKAIREDVSTAQLIDVFKHLPVDFPPGTEWQYSSSGYVVLGAIIEKVTGKPWHVAMREILLAPLGLARTAYDDGSTLIPHRALGYGIGAAGDAVTAPYISMTQASAAGGLVSTADDLMRWMHALHSGKVLSPDAYRRMTTVVTTASGRPTDYACGIAIRRVRGERAFEHVGRDPGFMSETLYLPESATGVVVLTNTDSPRADISVVAAKLAAIAIGRPYLQRHPTTLSAAAMQALAGAYRQGESDVRTIVVRDGRLYTKRDGGGEHVLRAASADELYFDEVPDYFKVRRNAAGKVVGLDQYVDGEAPPLHLPKRSDRTPPSPRR
jgi:CubicO group peptidase (beta-lactamase class C family)